MIKIGQQPLEIDGDDAKKALGQAIKNVTGKQPDVSTIKVVAHADGNVTITALAAAAKPPKKPAKKPATTAAPPKAPAAPPKSPFNS